MSDSLVTVRLTQRDQQRRVASVAGEIDHSSSDVLHSDVLALLDGEINELVLDFSQVSFCDSSGMSVLIGLQRHLRERDGSLTVAAAPRNVARALRLGGLAQLIPVHNSVPGTDPDTGTVS